FQPGPVSGTISTVGSSAATVTADGSATATITVTLLDAHANPVAGKSVSLTAGSGSSTITTLNGTTDAAGRATFSVKDTVAQSVTYSAHDTTDTLDLTQTTTVQFVAGPVSASVSTIAASATSLPADDSTTSTITVTLLDAQGNPVAGKDVSLSQAGASSTITTVGGTTNASGHATFTVKD